MDKKSLNIGLIGAGYWGKNYIKLIKNSQASVFSWCSDLDEKNLSNVKNECSSVKLTKDYREMLDDPGLDAVIVATPAASHYLIAKECLMAGKHALVEKPLAFTSKECEELLDVAKQNSVILAVGHTFVYNPAVIALKKFISEGAVGKLYYIYSTRVNLGIIREDLNAMWNLAPHDISILLYLLGKMPETVIAVGNSYLQKNIEDIVFINLQFPGNVSAQIHVSWLDPTKIRKLTVVGSKKMIVFDDIDNEARLKIYDKGISRIPLENAFGEYQLKLRAGDILIPKIDMSEPLKNEYADFIQSILGGREPVASGISGLDVVRVLEAAQQSLKNGGMKVRLDQNE
ncbi:Gfo/Idh/MocA family oxidoreductase [Candidatus Woesearchaeota archaeon]|nr:Gfo/Idh/MocA family oxidoreductase [Candidatus Woesearchaeota archaeon]